VSYEDYDDEQKGEKAGFENTFLNFLEYLSYIGFSYNI